MDGFTVTVNGHEHFTYRDRDNAELAASAFRRLGKAVEIIDNRRDHDAILVQLGRRLRRSRQGN